MTGFLAQGQHCSAYRYAWLAGLLTGAGDLEFLKCLGLRAWTLAQALGVRGWKQPEGPYLVWFWPEWIWDLAAKQMAEDAARFGDWAMTDEAAAQPRYWDETGYQ